MFVTNTAGLVLCSYCGKQLPNSHPPKRCTACDCATREKPGLGDMVAAGLSAVGITKERVQKVANAVGVKDCGCAKRQEALNNLGRKLGIG